MSTLTVPLNGSLIASPTLLLRPSPTGALDPIHVPHHAIGTHRACSCPRLGSQSTELPEIVSPCDHGSGISPCSSQPGQTRVIATGTNPWHRTAPESGRGSGTSRRVGPVCSANTTAAVTLLGLRVSAV